MENPAKSPVAFPHHPDPTQSPASEGEEEELLIEEEEEEVLTGASAEDKSRRPQGKGPSEPVHSGKRSGGGEEVGRWGEVDRAQDGEETGCRGR